jgi:hypothetical protein
VYEQRKSISRLTAHEWLGWFGSSLLFGRSFTFCSGRNNPHICKSLVLVGAKKKMTQRTAHEWFGGRSNSRSRKSKNNEILHVCMAKNRSQNK